MVIDAFRGEYRFLSNFYPAQVRLDFAPIALAGERSYQRLYRTTEHAFQAAKFFDPILRDTIRSCKTPAMAKRAARDHKQLWRLDWEFIRVSIMGELLRQKFSQEPFRTLLLNTGDATLVEGNTWGDTFWGICRGHGENMLGQLLMQQRESMK